MALERTRKNWRQLSRSDKWITQRMTGQETRKKLTDYWASHEIKQGEEFAILTNIIHEEWSGISVKQHKELKRLESHNIRDHMREAELIFTALAKLSTSQIAETEAAVGLPANKKAAKTAGKGWTGAFTRTTLKSASAGTVKVAVSDGRGSRGQKKTR